jgi:8-oxo-dGTP pyrophosphatase MutT (NUDIX family)
MLWSVSLVFYHQRYGFLIGQELRKKEKGLSFFPVGGKIEEFDKDPLDSAAREFMEETSLILNSYFQNLADEKLKEWKEKNNESEEEEPKLSSLLQAELYKFCNDEKHNITTFDHSLGEKEHRYFIVDISKSSNREFAKVILNLPFVYTLLPNELRMNDKMWSLFWIPLNIMHSLPNSSFIMNVLFGKLAKQYKTFSSNNNIQNQNESIAIQEEKSLTNLENKNNKKEEQNISNRKQKRKEYFKQKSKNEIQNQTHNQSNQKNKNHKNKYKNKEQKMNKIIFTIPKENELVQQIKKEDYNENSNENLNENSNENLDI